MAKKPSGLGRGLDELLEDNIPSRRPAAKGQKPLVEAKDEFVPAKSQNTTPSTPAPTAKPQNNSASLYQNKVKPLYNTQRPTLKSNFKNNLNNKDKNTR